MRWWRELRPYVCPAAIVVAYLIVREVFSQLAGNRGLLTPSGGIEAWLVVLGLVTLVLRLVVLVVVPLIVVYRLIWRVVRYRA